MGIMNYIIKEKEKFRDEQFRKKELLAKRETERLRAERTRQAELAKIQSEKSLLERDVKNISQFTEKHKDPTTMQKFGRGLAKVMNKGKEGVSRFKEKGYLQGVRIGAPPSEGSRGLDMTGRGDPFGGSRHLDVGSGSPFNIGLPEKKKAVIIRIQQ